MYVVCCLMNRISDVVNLVSILLLVELASVHTSLPPPLLYPPDKRPFTARNVHNCLLMQTYKLACLVCACHSVGFVLQVLFRYGTGYLLLYFALDDRIFTKVCRSEVALGVLKSVFVTSIL